MSNCEWRQIARRFAMIAGVVMPSCAEDDSAALSKVEYEDGYVEFVDGDSNPRRIHQLRGEMSVTVYENYVRVVLDDDDQTYIIPRERVVYAGIEIK